MSEKVNGYIIYNEALYGDMDEVRNYDLEQFYCYDNNDFIRVCDNDVINEINYYVDNNGNIQKQSFVKLDIGISFNKELSNEENEKLLLKELNKNNIDYRIIVMGL